jgi:hypothetical protein
MKTIQKIYLVFFLIFLASCNDEVLDIEPTDQLTDATVWNTSANAGLFLNDIYNSLTPGPQSVAFTNLPTEISNDPLDNFSDNSMSSSVLVGIPSFSTFRAGSYSPTAPMFTPHWSNTYANIRKCNVFIENVSKATFDATAKKGLVAQAKFLRAYFYKTLIDLYGGVPLVTKSLSKDKDGDEIFFPRNSYNECVEFIQKECDEAVIDLPLKVAAKDAGRVTKGAALTLKGRTELYASKWADAAATNLAIMQSAAGYALFPDY